MPVLTSELLLKLSDPTASSGNSAAQGNVNQSLGLYMSTTETLILFKHFFVYEYTKIYNSI